jgi:predicted Zn-dependent protease with MMP-like domain
MMRASPEEFLDLAIKAYDSLPEPFRQLSKDVVIQIADFADRDVLEEMDIPDPYELLGLYQGIDVTQKSGFDTVPLTDMVFLYRLPILRYCAEGTDTLEQVVTHVLVHEIGHHFGLSDDDMHALEDEAGED